jgi:hypothetical protein
MLLPHAAAVLASVLLVSQVAAAQNDGKKTMPATRLIFEYDGERVRLVQQMPVDISADTLSTAEKDSIGVFVEVRDAANRTLARVPAPEAMSTSIEAFPERHDQRITRSDVARPTGAFTVVVPVMAATDHITIVRTTPASGNTRAIGPTSVDLVNLPLKADGPQ